jgi:hypothetical protein
MQNRTLVIDGKTIKISQETLDNLKKKMKMNSVENDLSSQQFEEREVLNFIPENIKAICDRYGFEYKREGDNQFVIIDEEIFLARFGKGRNKLKEKARKVNPLFARDYPTRTNTSYTKRKYHTKFNVKKLNKYSAKELKHIVYLVQQVCDQKKKEEDIQNRINYFQKILEATETFQEYLKKTNNYLFATIEIEAKNIKKRIENLKKKIDN